MKKEYKYFLSIISLFAFSMSILFALLRKYALLTFEHFVETCRQMGMTLLSSTTHYLGLLLTALTFTVALIFCAKTIFSFAKTQKRVKKLLEYKSNKISPKLQNILKKLGLQKNKVIVIKRNSDHAFSYGLISQKIVISQGLIKKLTSKQLEAVVLHEFYHLSSKHPLLLIISEIISSALFFLPLIGELTNKMRVVFEKQADLFTTRKQQTNVHLNLALSSVFSKQSFDPYPNFVQRREYKTAKTNIVFSIFAIIMGISLFLLPIESHASQAPSTFVEVDNCNGNQCPSTHCLTEAMSKELIVTVAPQSHQLSVSY